MNKMKKEFLLIVYKSAQRKSKKSEQYFSTLEEAKQNALLNRSLIVEGKTDGNMFFCDYKKQITL